MSRISVQSDLRLLVKIATLYYDEGLKQSDIAKLLSLSQSFVSRSLRQCVKEGIVKINVAHPPNVFVLQEKKIQDKYGLSQAIIVDVVDNPSPEQVKRVIGSMSAHYLETTLSSDELIGVSSWSGTIRCMIDSMHPSTQKSKGIIQLLGGIGQNGNLQANMLAYSLANLLNCEPFLLPAINIESTVEDKKNLLKSAEVSSVVDRFTEVDIAIIGIGSMEPSTMLLNSGNYYNEKMAEKLASRGAVGDVCLHYFDKNGQAVLEEEEDPVISMSLQQLKDCPRVVALAGGMEKVEAIGSALKGGFIDVLITDRVTAESLA